jgi:hypothetical protein
MQQFLNELKEEANSLTKELKLILNKFNNDYDNLSTIDKRRINETLNKDIDFIDNIVDSMNKLNKEGKEEELNKVLIFFLDEFGERKKRMEIFIEEEIERAGL